MKMFKPKSIVNSVENYKIPFGKYRGLRLQEVEDIDYLQWMAEKSWSRLDRVVIKAYLEAYRKFEKEKPFYMPDKQLTKFIMLKRQQAKEKDEL